jgi:hypothetical protein
MAARIFVEEARRDAAAVAAWLQKDRRAAVHPRVLSTLVEGAPGAAAPLCRGVLLGGHPEEVRRMLRFLGAHGGEEALRIVVDAVRERPRGGRRELVEALALFPHSAAVDALLGILEANNGRDMDAAEVEAAARGLMTHALPGTRAFLWDIVENRDRRYRRALRALVEDVLEGFPA